MPFQYEYRGKGYDKKKKKKVKLDVDKDDDDQDKKSDGDETVDGHDTAAETDKPETDADRSVMWILTSVVQYTVINTLLLSTPDDLQFCFVV